MAVAEKLDEVLVEHVWQICLTIAQDWEQVAWIQVGENSYKRGGKNVDSGDANLSNY